MNQKKSDLKKAQAKANRFSEQVNRRIEELGVLTNKLNQQLTEIQRVFDEIRGISSEEELQLSELKKIRLNWEHQVEKIEADYRDIEIKASGFGAVGVGTGIAVAALGPTVAMGVATTFGVASTGTAISALSGAAATNAALAWLGGGTLVAGGSGIVGGELLVALTGPLGLGVALIAAIGAGICFFSAKADRDARLMKLAIVELEERINRIGNETKLLSDAIVEAKGFGTDYDTMTDQQQYELISFVNLMHSSTQLLVNPILGLQPKFTNTDLNRYFEKARELGPSKKLQDIMVALGNLLFKIKLDDTDKKVLWKAIRDNKNFIKAAEIKKKEFKFDIFQETLNALELKNKS